MPSKRKLLASAGSSPDPLSQSTGPTISTTPRTKQSPRKRRTTVFSTPTKVTTSTTSSPWRFRVVVEAERDDDPSAGDDHDESVMLSRGRKTRTRTTTTKIPLKGLSPEPAQKGTTGKRRPTPAKARSRSPTKAPAPKKTPAPKSTPRARGRTPVVVVEEEQQQQDSPLVEEMEVDEEPEVRFFSFFSPQEVRMQLAQGQLLFST